MKTIQKLFVLGLFAAGSVLMVGGCSDEGSEKPDKPATETPDKADGETEGSTNASVTPAADGVTKVAFNVTGMS